MLCPNFALLHAGIFASTGILRQTHMQVQLHGYYSSKCNQLTINARVIKPLSLNYQRSVEILKIRIEIQRPESEMVKLMRSVHLKPERLLSTKRARVWSHHETWWIRCIHMKDLSVIRPEA